MEGALAAGHHVEKISLKNKHINFCQGCFVCQSTKRCFMRDDADAIEQKMEKADVLVFATPIYYYEMSGQMKTMLDRGNPLYTSEYQFRDVYLLASAAENEHHAVNRAQAGLEGWIECFPKARFSGCVFAGGVTNAKDIQDHPSLKEAYTKGKEL